MRKIIILTSVLLLGIAFMAYYYFSKLGSENDAKDLALQSATNNAAVIFSFQNDKSFYNIIEDQSLIQQVLGNEKTELLKQLKTQVIDNRMLNGFTQDQPVYISLLPDTNKTINFLLTVQIHPDKEISNFYQQLKLQKQITAQGKDLYLAKLNDNLSVYFGIQNQVITVSTSAKLVKDAAVRLTENPFTSYIKESNRLNKNVLAQIYINYNQAPLLLKNILAGNINGELSLFNEQNSFATINYNFSKEKILFNGNTELKSSDNYLRLFEDMKVQAINIQNLLPENTANYVIYAFDSYALWQPKLSAWQLKKKLTDKVKGVINNVKREYRTDLNAIWPVFSGNQFVLFQLSTTEKLGAVALTNGEKVKQLLFDVSADYNEDIKIFKSSDILPSYFGEPFQKFGRPYYTIIDNNLIVANNASTIQSFLNSYRSNRLLIQEPEYQDALNQLSSTSSISYYINLKNSADVFRSNILLRYYKHLRADSGLKSFDTFFYQMSADKNKFITNMLLNKYLKPEIPDSLSLR